MHTVPKPPTKNISSIRCMRKNIELPDTSRSPFDDACFCRKICAGQGGGHIGATSLLGGTHPTRSSDSTWAARKEHCLAVHGVHAHTYNHCRASLSANEQHKLQSMLPTPRVEARRGIVQ